MGLLARVGQAVLINLPAELYDAIRRLSVSGHAARAQRQRLQPTIYSGHPFRQHLLYLDLKGGNSDRPFDAMSEPLLRTRPKRSSTEHYAAERAAMGLAVKLLRNHGNSTVKTGQQNGKGCTSFTSSPNHRNFSSISQTGFIRPLQNNGTNTATTSKRTGGNAGHLRGFRCQKVD